MTSIIDIPQVDVPENAVFIRTSERGTFKRCRHLWDFTSQNRRNLEPVRMASALSFGIAVHVALEHYYDPFRWQQALPYEMHLSRSLTAIGNELDRQATAEAEAIGGLDSERTVEYDEHLTLGKGMLRTYKRFSNNNDADWRPVAVEEKMVLPVVNPETGQQLLTNEHEPVFYQIRLDLLVEDPYEDLWIVDHKTAKSLGDLFFLEVDTQMMSYAATVQRILGRKVRGVVYNEIRKAHPTEPDVLKNGGLSKNKRQHTDTYHYLKAIDRLGLDRANYADMLDYLETNPKEYVRRTLVNYSQRELATQERYIFEESLEMLNDPTIYPNAHKFNCNGCAFIGPCTVRNEDGDFEFLLNDRSVYRERTVTEDDTRND